ncbi:MAG: NADP-dependent glyceraldehyde-3-phosphate dehydrogenase [Deltaproteobacteria bacterium]
MDPIKKEVFPQINNISGKYMIPIPYDQKEYLLNGEILEWNGEKEEVYSPVYFKLNDEYTNKIGTYPLMDRSTSLKSLEAAIKAYDNGNGEWPSMSVENRISCLNKFVLLMKEQRNIVVNLLMWEIGKSLADSEKEFDRTIEYINDTIAALKDADRDASRFTIKQGIIAQIRRAPLGVVLCMGPFNYPLNETFTTLIPALIMGNTIIFKPPKLGVLLHSPLLRAFCEAFPKGVVNTIYGDGREIIGPLMESGKINVLAFIGTSRVADILKKQHPLPHRLRSVLGLEAKNPAIILNDADIENTVKEVISGSLAFNGQRCTALKILFVQDGIYKPFINMLSSEVEKLKAGMPWDDQVNITPLPEPGKPEQMMEYINDALQKGGKLVNQNGGQNERSMFFPAILSDVNETMRIYHEEQFGPIIPVVRFSKIEEPLDYVEKSNYGQQASIFSSDARQIAALTDKLVNQVCRVNINSQCQRGPDAFPFTGRKDSAEGTLSVTDALRVFSIRTLVALKETEHNKQILNDILKNKHSGFLSTDFIL